MHKNFGVSNYTRKKKMTTKTIKFFSMTFNLSNSEVEQNTFSFIPAGFDIYALAFEEVGPFIPMATIKKQHSLTASLNNHFGKDYFMICDVTLLAIKLYIVARRQFKDDIKIKLCQAVETGADGAYGNKGGCWCSFTFNSTYILAIAAHFAAGDDKIQERNENFAVIMNSIQEKLKSNPMSTHHFIFFMGDFNYRLNASYDVITKLANSGRYNEMLEFDQLTNEKRLMHVFTGFFEEQINFPPTYKFNKKSLSYDTSKKMRVPSFTDRILTFSRNRSKIKFLGYGANMDILISDHRPVFAKFELILNNPVDEIHGVLQNQKSIVCNIA